MGGLSAINNLIFRKTSTFALATIVTAFFFERAFDMSTEALFDHLNKGKTWKEIKHRYNSD